MTTVHPIYRTRRGLAPDRAEILDRGSWAILGTTNPRGTAHLAPVMFLYEDGRLLMETSGATRKARNAAVRPDVTVLVLDPRVDGTAWVCATGTAEIVSGEDAHAIGRRIRARYFTELGERKVGSVLAEHDDVVIAVTPERWTSWSMDGINDTLAALGVSFEDADDWYHPTG